MEIQPFSHRDLSFIGNVQPENWDDITPKFQFYLANHFCFPIKATVDKRLAGVGSLILHQNTAWLAHIIVNPDFRRRGFGYRITEALVKLAEGKKCKTISLLATEFGRPVYEKLGFTPEITYRFFKGSKLDAAENKNIRPFHSAYTGKIKRLDRHISGEDRSSLLDLYLDESFVFVKNEEIIGYFLRDFAEGPVYAITYEAGVELVKYRCQAEENKIIVPEKNEKIISFLVDNGYQEIYSCFRMVLGGKLTWNPQMVYNRIGGYLG